MKKGKKKKDTQARKRSKQKKQYRISQEKFKNKKGSVESTKLPRGTNK